MLSSCILPMALAAALAAAGPAPGNDQDVICHVNGEPIRLKDLEMALFVDDYQLVAKNVLPFLVQEQVVRQEMADKGVSVKAADIEQYLADLDRKLRAKSKTTLRKELASAGMDLGFFRRKVETTLGLYRLAGGKERPFLGMSASQMRARMNGMLQRLTAQAKVVIAIEKLPAGTAAMVNGEKISVKEASRVARMSFSRERKRRRLAQLQRFVVARQEMRRRKIEFTKDDIEYQLKLASSARTTRIGEAVFPLEKILEKLGRDLDRLKKEYGFRRVAMLTRMVKGEVAEKELRKLFAADRTRFGDGVPKASHILLKIVDAAGQPLPARARRKAKARVQELYRRLRAGEDFAKLAGQFSEDERTKERGGNLGYLDPAAAKKDPAVRAAYSLKAGEVSKPISGRLGWQLVKVTEINRVSFEEARPLVLATAIRLRRNQLEGGLLRKVKIKPGPAEY